MAFKALLNSRLLGSTKSAIDRRKEILRILDENGPKDIAQIIDFLREKPAYKNLNKKSHMTQIKNDVEYLRALNLIAEFEREYYLVNQFF